MARSTPRKLRNKPVLEVLQRHDYRVADAAAELGVSVVSIYAWLKRNKCQRIFVNCDTQGR